VWSCARARSRSLSRAANASTRLLVSPCTLSPLPSHRSGGFESAFSSGDLCLSAGDLRADGGRERVSDEAVLCAVCSSAVRSCICRSARRRCRSEVMRARSIDASTRDNFSGIQ